MNLEALAFLANTVLIGNALAALCSVVFWMLARAKGLPISKVEFLYGPSKRLFQISGTAFTLGTIPYGSSVHYDIPQFRSQSLLWRIAVQLVGCGVLMVIAVATTGAGPAWSYFLSGPRDLLLGAFQPSTTAQHLIAQMHHLYDKSLIQTTGVIAAKIAAFSVIPGIGPAFVHVLREIMGRDENEDLTLNKLLTAHAFILLALSGVWAYAMVRYFLVQPTA